MHPELIDESPWEEGLTARHRGPADAGLSGVVAALPLPALALFFAGGLVVGLWARH